MSGMGIEASRCTLCGRCVEACPFDGIQLGDACAVFNDNCRMCGLCIEACPFDALYMTGSATEGSGDVNAYRGVLVYAQQRHGHIHPVTYELLGVGADLARPLNQPLAVAVMGHGMDRAADELRHYGADYVYVFDDVRLSDFNVEWHTAALTQLVIQHKPSIVLLGATPLGRSLAPRAAARLRTGLTADCTALSVKNDGCLVQTRPAFGGNVMAQIVTPYTRPQMATVRHKVMSPARRHAAATGSVVRCRLDGSGLDSRIELLHFQPRQVAQCITSADVIVAAGRGVNRPDGMDMVYALADALGGTVAVTRPLVEQGWADVSRQVGMSGRTVRPKLYVACGISGAIQHVAGMRGSDFIIAINEDPDAPIFDVAHQCLVGDVFEIIPALLQQMKKGASPDVLQ